MQGAGIEVKVKSVSISTVYWHHCCVRVSLYGELLGCAGQGGEDG